MAKARREKKFASGSSGGIGGLTTATPPTSPLSRERGSIERMSVVTGRVVDGRVVVEDVELPEGAFVDVYIDDAPELGLSEAEEAELEAAMNDIRSGNYVSADELFRRLREQE